MTFIDIFNKDSIVEMTKQGFVKKMINQILSRLGLGDGSLNIEINTRRRHVRYAGMQAEVVVGERAYSIRDWSQGGVLFETQPDSRMIVGDRIRFQMKFRFPHEVITVSQEARVVRTNRQGVAAEFLSPSPDMRHRLERVVDNYHAQSFLESQVA